MWTGGMTVADSIVISLVGLLVVFSALAVLAVAVIIISKIIGALFKTSAPKAAAAVAAGFCASVPLCSTGSGYR